MNSQGAKRRLQFDTNKDGLLSADELPAWKRDALIFALRHTVVRWNGESLKLKPSASPAIDLYDFPQTGAKPARELVYLEGILPEGWANSDAADAADIAEPTSTITLGNNLPPAISTACLSHVFYPGTAGPRLISSIGGMALSYGVLRAASNVGEVPDGFTNDPTYLQEWIIRRSTSDGGSLRQSVGGEDVPAIFSALSQMDIAEPSFSDGKVDENSSPYSRWMNDLGERLFDRSNPTAWWLGVLLAFAYGMAHALSPGHGKALVSAWLLGRRGRVTDAVVAGLAATFTHTILVFILGVTFTAVRFFTVEHMDALDRWLSLGAGVITLGLGLWLFRLANQGGHHHGHAGDGHHHHAHDHHHGFGHRHDDEQPLIEGEEPLPKDGAKKAGRYCWCLGGYGSLSDRDFYCDVWWLGNRHQLWVCFMPSYSAWAWRWSWWPFRGGDFWH